MARQLSKKESRSLWKDKKRDLDIVVVLENIMYATNVASKFRTSEAAGVSNIYLTGFSKTPPFGNDLKKTSRSSENRISWEHASDMDTVFRKLRTDSYYIIGVEISDDAINNLELPNILSTKKKVCFVFGNEAHGMSKKAMGQCDLICSIPQYGKNTSLNVSVSAGIILFSF